MNIIDAEEYLEIMDYLDDIQDNTENMSLAQCVADAFDVTIEIAEKLVRDWHKIQQIKSEEE